jgi:DNA-binding CsgD family transcriptional regulator
MNQISSAAQSDELSSVFNLTTREVEILKRVAQGNTDREIANLLGLSEKTIHHHVEHILVKLRAKNRTHAVVKGLQLNVVQL